MRLYRICREAHRALDGEGARQYGGRWNSPGLSVVYTSASLALAALEYLVHVDADNIPSDLVALTIEVSDSAPTATVSASQLPDTWAAVVEHPVCKTLGDAWAREGTALVLRVPSAPIPEEENVLINAAHPKAQGVRVIAERPFVFDPRLLE